jgi:hypothetical protein
VTAPTDASTGVDPDTAVLAVPHALDLPAAALARLRRQYDDRRPSIGVVAPVRSLPPGSSVTTAAEWAATVALDRCEHSDELDVHGAVLLAPGVRHAVGERTVQIELSPPGDPRGRTTAGSGLLVDPGAAAFDPHATATTPAPLTDQALPPFRWRPLVLLLAGHRDDHRAAVAAELGDALLDLDVEVRLAVHGPLPPPLRTGPLVASPAIVAALMPDLVIALDDEGLGWAERSVRARRSMVTALLDEDLGERIELVPWNLAAAQGRLRARIGGGADPRAVAHLVNRLCSGPIPVAPTDEPDAAPPPRPATSATPVTLADADGAEPRAAAPPPTFAVLGTGDPADGEVRRELARQQPVLAGLTDHLLAAGWACTAAGADRDADLVLTGPTAPGVGDDRAVVVVEDLDAAALVAARAGTGARRRRAIAATGPTAAVLRDAGVDTIVTPRLRTRSELQVLTEAVERRVRPAVATIALLVGIGGSAPDPGVADALSQALDHVVDQRGELELVVIGEGVSPPTSIRHPPRLGAVDLADPGRVVGWSLAVLLDERAEGTSSDGLRRSVPDDRTQTLTTLALAGVPVVMGSAAAAGLGSLADPSLVVAGPSAADGWTDAIARLLDDDQARTSAADRARRLGEAVAGDAAAALVVQRVTGWAEATR